MICTPCGQLIVEGQLAMFGADRGDGILTFGWACCHKPVGDVAVILGSMVCVQKFLNENPQYTDAISILIQNHKHSRSQNASQNAN